MVGFVVEPRIDISLTTLQFNQALVSHVQKKIFFLQNNENIPIEFVVETGPARKKEGGEDGQVFTFEPIEGIIPPLSKCPVTVTFCPDQEIQFSKRFSISIKKKPTKLQINLKGSGCMIKENMLMELTAGQIINFTHQSPNHLDFGLVHSGQQSSKQIHVKNIGSMTFEYAWRVQDSSSILISPLQGTVLANQSSQITVTFAPQKEIANQKFDATCRINDGNKYRFVISGACQKPKIRFDPQIINFGSQLLSAKMETDSAKIVKQLKITNEEEKEISISSQFVSNQIFQITSLPSKCGAGMSVVASFTFQAMQSQAYQQKVGIEINGSYKKTINLQGEGITLSIRVLNLQNLKANFGSVRLNNSVTRNIQIQNKCKCPVTLDLAQIIQELASYFVDIQTQPTLVLASKEIKELQITFKPKKRIQWFSKDFYALIQKEVHNLFQIQGVCLSSETYLDTEVMPFGAVPLGSQLTKSVQIINDGETDTTFMWENFQKINKDFSIKPQSGYVGAKQQAQIFITFKPQAINQDIRLKLQCSYKDCSPNSLIVIASCFRNELKKQNLTFQCKVRKTDTQVIPILNNTQETWLVEPVIQNDLWQGKDKISIHAGDSHDYQLQYQPVTQSSSKSPHLGQLLLILPNGVGTQYSLIGVADQPDPEEIISRDIVTRKQHQEVILVKNWLSQIQRFQVQFNKDGLQPSVIISGPAYIDVPANSSKDFRFNFTALLDGVSSFTAKFQNDTTAEFLLYKFDYKHQAGQTEEEINIQCDVRQQVEHDIVLQNPLDIDSEFSLSCKDAKFLTFPSTVKVNAQSREVAQIKFLPLYAQQQVVELDIKSKDLGVTQYKINLLATPCKPEKTIYFQTQLGNKEVKPFTFSAVNLDKNVEFTCYFKSSQTNQSKIGYEVPPKFQVQKSNIVEQNQICLDVTFEPNVISENSRDILVLTSPQCGEYECVLIGKCVQPKPVGPINCISGNTIPFKNIFLQDMDFVYQSDNPCFIVKNGEKIPSKKSVSIQIQYKEDSSKPKTGRLLIKSTQQEQLQWQYYLVAFPQQ